MTRGLFTLPELVEPPAFEMIVRDEPVPSGIRPVPLKRGQEVIGSRLAEGRDSKHEKRIKAWRELLRSEATRALDGRDRLLGPLAVEMSFARPRLASHYGTGRNAGVLKPGAPAHPTTRPDVLKLARLVEDALTGPVWADDAQIVSEWLRESWVPTTKPPGVRVRAWELPALEVEVRDLENRMRQLERLVVPNGESLVAQVDAIADELIDPPDPDMADPVDAGERLRRLARRLRVEMES